MTVVELFILVIALIVALFGKVSFALALIVALAAIIVIRLVRGERA